MRCVQRIVFLLMPLDWLLSSLLGDTVPVLSCQVPMDSSFILSFWWRLIMKMLLRQFSLIACQQLTLWISAYLFFLSLIGAAPLTFQSSSVVVTVLVYVEFG